MKELDEYIRDIRNAFVSHDCGCLVAEKKDGCVVLRHVPMIFSNAVARMLAPMSVHIEEEADGKNTIVANADSWAMVQKVL